MVKDTQASRLYPTVTATGATKWVTRDIAALDFLLGIPMQRQGESVRTGWERQDRPTPTGKWWERDVMHAMNIQNNKTSNSLGANEHQALLSQSAAASQEESVIFLERPLSHVAAAAASATQGGGRRLEGDTATKVEVPQAGLSKSTRQRYIARQAQMREWECQVVAQDVLSARMFFSAKDNYPVSVFSVIKYEPKREEAARRRQKLEARGGGGTQFVVPARDWRGTSYRALLPRRLHHKKHNHRKGFNRFVVDAQANETNEHLDEMSESSSSDEEDAYVPGFLDDPEMRQGRHRHVMIGDRNTGCIVSSTIQFVKPAELKADLNKQFRERFDGWEPPETQRKYIGAKIIDGVYTLVDPNEGGDEEEIIRMPPSLTLSKIRSAKQQILLAAIHNAQLEVSTVALSFVYFERLCLDCRVDKSNRRLSFAACLLLAAKINESKITLLVHREGEEQPGLRSLIRPTKDASTIFASLLEFFTQDWGLSLKHLFSAEWGVFAALGFRLHATPSQVEFHFRRIMKVLGWNAPAYLGHEMYTQWQDCLEAVEERERERDARREIRRDLKERNLLKLELQRQLQEKEWTCQEDEEQRKQDQVQGNDLKPKQHMGAMKLIHRFTSSLARPSPIERGSNVERLSLAGTSMPEPSRKRRSARSAATANVVATSANCDPLSSTSHEPARGPRLILRSSSLPLLAADESQTNVAPISPVMPQHLGIDISDDGTESGIGNSSSANATDYDEEAIRF